jgi:hypothetical protein
MEVSNMTNIMNTIYDIVRSHNGIKCIDIVKITHINTNSVSGTLSTLKYRGMIFNDNTLWYVGHGTIHNIKHALNYIHKLLPIPLNTWAPTYVNALCEHGVIDENEFDELIEYIKK